MEKMRQRAVSWCPGSTFPTPYPQGYGATPPLPRPAQSACDVSGSMPEAGPVWQCRMRCTRTSRIRMTALRDRSAPLRTPPPAPHPAPATGAAPGGPGGRTEAVPPAPPVPPTRRKGLGRSGTSGPAGQEVPGGLLIPAGRKGRDCSLDDGRTPPLGRPDTPIQVARRSAAPGGATPRTALGGARKHTFQGGRAPVHWPVPAYATGDFQPTSHPCRFLAEMADQPPCHQAGRDRTVRFYPTGMGHQCDAHFPARPTGETLRDRMHPAKLPCRHNAGW